MMGTNCYQQHQLHPVHAHQPPHYHDPCVTSLAFRPLQLPLPQSQLQYHAQHHPAASPAEQSSQQQIQLHSLELVRSSGGYTQHPNFGLYRQPTTLPHRTRPDTRPDQQRTMSYDQGQAASDDELSQLQKLSNEYEAPTTGPLVSQRQPSTAITTEYASADPVYQAKTQALPQKYSHYRTVRGDGKCGWRAVAFGYFETLIRHGDSNRFGIEEARLRSLHNVMVNAGFDQMLFEDFADETYGLLRELANAVHDGQDVETLLCEKFNDDMLQNYIITHMRTLTAAWMQTRDAEYAPWLLGQTTDAYVKNMILPVGAEIDHVGLSALKDALLSPAGITLEVLYLDRSEGSEVTMHRFDPVASGGFTLGSVRLLYRPGHYDLLYKPEDLPTATPPTTVQTYLQYGSQTHHEPVYDLGVSSMPDFMTMIPGISYAAPSQSWNMTSNYGNASSFSFSGQVPPCTPTAPNPSPEDPLSHTTSQPLFASTSTPTHMVPPPTQLTHDVSIRSAPQVNHDYQPQFGGSPFRPSAWQLEPDFLQATAHAPFQTSIFRNSHFNQAHFLNPDFQPEQWDPQDEYATGSSSSSKCSRHRNSG